MIQSTQEASRVSAKTVTSSTSETDGSYQSISKSALTCFVFAIFSLGALLTPEFIILPVIGLVLSVFAWLNFRRYPQELIGRPFMTIGGVMCATLLVAGTAWHTYCYNTEVPADYERILYSLLKPEKNSKLPYSNKAEELDGKRVFIKGYVRPSDRKTNLKDFILVGDFGQCCFGGNPKINEVIAVTFSTDDRIDYSLRRRHIGGTFHLNKNTKRTSEKDIPKVLYTIDADYLK